MNNENESLIPEGVKDIGRALAQFAKDNDLGNFTGYFTLGFFNPWHHGEKGNFNERVQFYWDSGRHYDGVDKIALSCDVRANVNLKDDKKGKE